MAIHAAMVDRMDREIGRVLAQLRAMGAFDNTLIFFLSDNGASAEIMVRDDGHDPAAPAGSAAHASLPGAGLVDRGQHAVPPPQDLGSRRGHLDAADRPLAEGIAARGELRRDPGHVIDIVPTILELAGAPRLESDADPPCPARARDEPGAGLRPRRRRQARRAVVAARRKSRDPRGRLEARRRRARTGRGSCTTWRTIAPRRMTSRASSPKRSASWRGDGKSAETNSPPWPARPETVTGTSGRLPVGSVRNRVSSATDSMFSSFPRPGE